MKSIFVTIFVGILPGIVLLPEVISASVVVFTVAILWLGHQVRRRRHRWIEARLQELEAYCRLEIKLHRGDRPGELGDQAKRVCRLVSEHSAFSRVALLILNPRGQMPCAGSCGMDELALNALDKLGRQLLQDERTVVEKAPASFAIVLNEQDEWSAVPECAEMTIVPLRLRTGKLAGLIAVRADARMQRRIDLAQRSEGLPPATMPLEMLAANMGSKLERRRWGEQAAQIDPLTNAELPGAGINQEQVDSSALLVKAT